MQETNPIIVQQNKPEKKEREAVPTNGIKGLSQWRHDIPAALVVSLVSVPLSLGIALASGAPPICGLTSEIIAGLIFPLLGGSYVSICGPAAGLAPILFTAITSLGGGNMDMGYHLVLGVILMTGFMQLVLTYFKAAKFSQIFPSAAIHGMLAAIGFLLIAKQIPNFIGSKFHAHEFFAIVAEAPSELLHHLNPQVFSIGLICLLLLFQLSSSKLRTGFLRFIPPQLIVVLAGIILGRLYHVDSACLVHIPDNPLEHGIVFPDFHACFSDITLLPKMAIFVLALTFIDGTESLATIQAVDRIDPFHRKSSPDRTLFAMGISNICSSLIGGLTIIPGIIKSTTCIVSGGRTAWVNFYNALFLIVFVLFGGELIKMIPIAALAAVLIHIGYKLAGLHKWKSMAKLGSSQLAVFAITIFVTLSTDLLVGIGAGMLAKCFVLFWYEFKTEGAEAGNNAFSRLLFAIKSLFKSPLEKTVVDGDVTHLYFSGAIDCFNSLKVRSTLEGLDNSNTKVVLHFGPAVSLIDHSMNVYFQSQREDWKRANKTLEFEGFESFEASAKDPTSLKYRVAHT